MRKNQDGVGYYIFAASLLILAFSIASYNFNITGKTTCLYKKKQIHSILQITRRKAFFVRNWRLELELENIYISSAQCTAQYK